MRVFVSSVKRNLLDVDYEVDALNVQDLTAIPKDVLDRHEKVMLELEAVQRILRMYVNEG